MRWDLAIAFALGFILACLWEQVNRKLRLAEANRIMDRAERRMALKEKSL